MAHITKAQQAQLKQGVLPDEAMMELLEHMETCDECALLFADSLSETELRAPPKNFRRHVMEEAFPKLKRRKKEYHFYILQVTAAVAATLILIFSGVFTQIGNLKFDKLQKANQSFSTAVNEAFDQFSNKFSMKTMEDEHHEQTKK